MEEVLKTVSKNRDTKPNQSYTQVSDSHTLIKNVYCSYAYQ